MIKLAVFDLDGTLINSIFDLADSVNYALESNGFPIHDVSKYYRFVGDGVFKLIERALPADQANEYNILKLKSIFDERYNHNYNVKTTVYSGINETLKKLKVKNIKLAVLSNKPDVFSKKIVEEFFPCVFDYCMGNTDKFPKKPSPDSLIWLMNKYGVACDETVMIGDSDVDVNTGKNAGVKTIGALWGFRGDKELRDSGVDYIAASAEEIAEIISCIK